MSGVDPSPDRKVSEGVPTVCREQNSRVVGVGSSVETSLRDFVGNSKRNTDIQGRDEEDQDSVDIRLDTGVEGDSSTVGSSTVTTALEGEDTSDTGDDTGVEGATDDGTERDVHPNRTGGQTGVEGTSEDQKVTDTPVMMD